VIGRREDCDLRIPLSEVSRKHCRFLRDGDGLRIEDLGSSNGTYHNGQRVQEALISPGDTIQVGPVVFCVQIDGVPAEEDMSPILPSAAAESANESGVVPAIPSDEQTEETTEETIDEAIPEGELEELTELEDLPAEEEAVPSMETGEEELMTLEETPAEEEAVPELESLELTEEEAIEPIELEETPSPSAAVPTPPPLPVASEDEESLELVDHSTEETVEGTGEVAEEELLEDFEIIEDESHASQSGNDLTVDSEQQ
jgi:pSer/pThr/pTyr-binding forkhead associated (FHA) protein